MRVDVIKDCQEITVKAVRFPHQRGTVLYACLPCDTETIAGHRASGQQIRFIWYLFCGSILWGWKVLPGQTVVSPIERIYQFRWSMARLAGRNCCWENCEGPAISFSEGGGKIWAALCGDPSDIGIDVAGTDEFPKEYPFHWVFHAQELQHALRLTSGDLEKASALLWSIKEAAVKALGCAFHLVDPRQVCVYPSAAEKDGWYIFTVCLSGKALMRFPMMAEPMHIGTFAFPGEDVAFHRPVELATDQDRNDLTPGSWSRPAARFKWIRACPPDRVRLPRSPTYSASL